MLKAHFRNIVQLPATIHQIKSKDMESILELLQLDLLPEWMVSPSYVPCINASEKCELFALDSGQTKPPGPTGTCQSCSFSRVLRIQARLMTGISTMSFRTTFTSTAGGTCIIRSGIFSTAASEPSFFLPLIINHANITKYFCLTSQNYC